MNDGILNVHHNDHMSTHIFFVVGKNRKSITHQEIHSLFTVMTLSFLIGRSGQTVQTQIRLLEEQSDQGLHFLLFHMHHFDKMPFKVWPVCLNFRYITAKFSGVPKFRNFMVFL